MYTWAYTYRFHIAIYSSFARSNNRLIIKYSLVLAFCILKKQNMTSLTNKEKPGSTLQLIK